jgi:protein TonB
MPDLALRRGIRGIVELELTVSKEGAVTNAKTISGDPILAQAAKKAVLEWRYQPARLNGQPVGTTASVRISFGVSQ